MKPSIDKSTIEKTNAWPFVEAKIVLLHKEFKLSSIDPAFHQIDFLFLE